jgi:predicted amino acid-binding ACT domain protein
VRLGDFTDVLRALDASVAGTAVDLAGALDAFEKAAGDAETRWMEAAPDAQLAAINSALDFLYRLGDNEEAGARAAGILARGSRGVAGAGPVPPRAIGPAVWSAGVLTRLSRERDLPTGVREELRARFAECFGRGAAPGDFTFRSGAAAMALSLPPRLVQAAESGAAPSAGWSAWQRVVDALSGVDAELAIRLKVHALEGLLVSSPEPTQDQGVFEGVTLLTTGLTWRKGEASRRALLRWFDSPGVSNADLNTLTSALATRSGAEGVDYSMVLSPNAGESQRAEMRARYATVWGLDAQESRESLSEAWRQAAEALLNSGTPSDPAQWLERAVRQSRLNEAATRLWRGDLDGVGEAIRAAGESISAAAQPPGPVGGVPGPRLPQMDAASASGSWAVRYLGARQHIGQRREILATVATIPNALEAEVLVEEACRGTPQSVRADARAIVLRFADEPTVINALLEFAPFMPPTNDNAELVRTVSAAPVPRPRDPGFRVAVRRALVERLMQKLSGMGDLAYVDRLAEELADSYAARAPRAPDGAASLDPSASPSTRARPTPEAAARAERVRLRREAESAIASGREPFTLSDLDNRRAARERVAQGRVQVFAVEQTGVSELLAFVVVAESPTRAQAVAEVVRELDDRRRGAGHVFEQLEAAERAAVKLWRLRYAPGGAS